MDSLPRDACEFCNGTGHMLCEECGDVTGFSATVKTERGELCVACAEHFDKAA